MHFYKI